MSSLFTFKVLAPGLRQALRVTSPRPPQTVTQLRHLVQQQLAASSEALGLGMQRFGLFRMDEEQDAYVEFVSSEQVEDYFCRQTHAAPPRITIMQTSAPASEAGGDAASPAALVGGDAGGEGGREAFPRSRTRSDEGFTVIRHPAAEGSPLEVEDGQFSVSSRQSLLSAPYFDEAAGSTASTVGPCVASAPCFIGGENGARVEKRFDELVRRIVENHTLNSIGQYKYSVPADTLDELKAQLEPRGIRVFGAEDEEAKAAALRDGLFSAGRSLLSVGAVYGVALAGEAAVTAVAVESFEAAAMLLLGPVAVAVVVIGGVAYAVYRGMEAHKATLEARAAARSISFLEARPSSSERHYVELEWKNFAARPADLV